MKIEAKINKDVMKDIQADVKKYLETYARESAKYAAKKLTEKAQYCIEQFYKDYPHPDYYDRTYDLRDNSYSPYMHNNGRVYFGGVRISSDDMSPYYSGFSKVNTSDYTDPIVIAQLGWHGYHGHPVAYGNFKPIITPAPLGMLKEYFQSDEFNDGVREYATKKAKENEYKYLGDYL